MKKQVTLSKKSDFILGITALLVVSGLCLIGAHSLMAQTQEIKLLPEFSKIVLK